MRLGPLEATTLAGGDLAGIRQWLSDNGYQMRDEVLATMRPYLDGGWSFVAMRLTSDTTLRGALDPVRLSFAADHPVYPMRMSRAATRAQTVRVYVLGPHSIRRDDPDDTKQLTDTYFAGRIQPADADLKQLSANGNDYLTALLVTIGSPERITSDFGFVPSPTDFEYREVEHRVEYVRFLGVPGGFIALGAVLVLITSARLLRHGGTRAAR